jgi:Domain of unknown function (DUF6950)
MADVSRPGLALPDYLASLRLKRWQPGVLDCGVFMADWVREITGRDPIADVRGCYATERQFLRILRREGGFAASCVARLKAVGFRETATPGAGDLALVLAPYAIRRGKTQRRPTGAICVAADRFAVVTSDLGLVIAGRDQLPPLQAFTHA